MSSAGGYQGYGAPSEQELLEAMAAKEGNFSPVQKVPDSYNQDALDRDRDLLYAMQGNALDSSPTTLAGGLSRLGQAWLARGADKKITGREDEMRAGEEAKAMQAQQKRDEMVTAMVGGDENAFAALYPEEYAKNQFEMKRDAAKQDPFVVNNQIVDRQTLESSADFRDEQGPLSDAGKLFADANAGHLSPDQAEARFAKMNEARGALVNVNTGDVTSGERPIAADPGKGYQNYWDGEQWVQKPIEGSQAHFDESTREIKGFTALNASREQWGTMKETLDSAIGFIDAGNNAGWGALLSGLPESEQRSLANQLRTIKALIGFDKMREMQQNSPTGATGLGQITEKEIEFLQSVRGTIDQLDDPAELRKVLVDVRASLGRIHEVENLAYKLQYRIPLDEQDAMNLARYESQISNSVVADVVGMQLSDGTSITEADIQRTMQEEGMTRAQVVEALQGGQ